nr:ribonuclease H-like domain-containing protein [Tanacetum cinerariifolium]
MQQLINLINSNPVKNVQAYMADSGANQHMVTSLDKFENVVDISDLNLKIDNPNGTTALIKKVGNLKLSEKITLYDVLYVPEYTDLHLKKTMGTGSQQGDFQKPSPTNTLPDDETKTDSQDNDGESSSDDGIGYSFESLGNDATMDYIAHSSNDDNIVEQNSTSEGNQNIENLDSEPVVQRRSRRVSNLPTKLSDFVFDDKVKYGIQKHVNYSKLSTENYRFSTNLNKTIEPTSYHQA